MVEEYLSEARWRALAGVVPGKIGDPGRHGRDNRFFLEAVFWIARTRLPWRSLPQHFGKWYTIYTRYRRWEKNGVWPRIIAALAAHDGVCPFVYEAGQGIRWDPRAAEEKRRADSHAPRADKAA